jgi:hypothetical protein
VFVSIHIRPSLSEREYPTPISSRSNGPSTLEAMTPYGGVKPTVGGKKYLVGDHSV